MGRQHTLRVGRGAGGVQDGGVVFRGGRRCRHLGGRAGDELLPGGESFVTVPDRDQFDVEAIEMRQQPFGPFHVREQELETAVLDSVDQFLTGPPCVDGHRHGAHRRDPHERGDPLRVVAQGDTDPVTWLDSTCAEPVGALRGPVPHGLEGEPLILVDVEVLVGLVESAGVEIA